MLLLNILLLPFKLAIKIAAFILMLVMKLVGVLFHFIGAVLRVPFVILGFMFGLAGILYIIMSVFNPELREVSTVLKDMGLVWIQWWTPGLITIIIGAFTAYFPSVSEGIGDFLIDKGDDIWFAASCIDFF